MILTKKELKKKIDEFFFADTTCCSLKEEMIKFIWDYANKCYIEGRLFGRNVKAARKLT